MHTNPVLGQVRLEGFVTLDPRWFGLLLEQRRFTSVSCGISALQSPVLLRLILEVTMPGT